MRSCRSRSLLRILCQILNHEEVKRAAIENMFESSGRLFGTQNRQPSVQQIESRVPDAHMIEASDGENYDEYIDDRYMEQPIDEAPPEEHPASCRRGTGGDTTGTPAGYRCEQCGAEINDRVHGYSVNKFGRPLCIKCQRGAGKK